MEMIILQETLKCNLSTKMQNNLKIMNGTDFPGGKASAYYAEDPGSIPGLRRSSGEGNGNPLQYSCL